MTYALIIERDSSRLDSVTGIPTLAFGSQAGTSSDPQDTGGTELKGPHIVFEEKWGKGSGA